MDSLDSSRRAKRNQALALEKRILEIQKVRSLLDEMQNILSANSGQQAYSSTELHLNLLDETLRKDRTLTTSLDFILKTSTVIRKHFRSCFLIVDRAGSGKTNLLCHLAKKYSKSQATIFVSGRVLLDDEFSLEDYIVKSIRRSEIGLNFNNLDEVKDFLAECSKGVSEKKFFVFIDGINENSNIALLKRAIQRILATSQIRNILFCISCRDIFWDFFKDEFWDKFVYQFAKSKLYNFTQQEFAVAVERYLSYYRINCELQDDALEKCRQPLLLRFFCEAHGDPSTDIVNVGPIKEIRLKKLFDDYWLRKISNTRTSLGYRTSRDVEIFLFGVSKYMRENSTRSIPLSELKRITSLSDLDSDRSIYIRLLDEDIVIEEGSSPKLQPWITFVYDEFMEYAIAKEITNSLDDNSPENVIEKTINELVEKYEEFENIEGVIGYMCIMFVAERRKPIWDFLINRGKPWTIVVSKAINQLSANEITQTEFEALQKLSELDDEVKSEVLKCVERIHEVSSFDLTHIWVNLFSSPQTRLVARDYLVDTANKGKNAALSVFINALNHPSEQLRALAVYSVARIRSVAPSNVIHLMKDQSDLVRQAVGYALQFFPSAHKHLLRMLEDRIADVRRQACLSLKGSDDISVAIKLLSVSVNDFDERVQEAARNSIHDIMNNVTQSDQIFLLRELMRDEELAELEASDQEPNSPPYVYDVFFEEPIVDNDQANPIGDVISLNQPVDDILEDDIGPFEFIEYVTGDDSEYYDESNEQYEILATALASLSQRERQVLELNFGLGNGSMYTPQEISRRLKLSVGSIHNIKHKALSKLLHMFVNGSFSQPELLE